MTPDRSPEEQDRHRLPIPRTRGSRATREDPDRRGRGQSPRLATAPFGAALLASALIAGIIITGPRSLTDPGVGEASASGLPGNTALQAVFRPPVNISHSPTVSHLPQRSPRCLALDPAGRAFLIWVEAVPHTEGTALELALCQYFLATGWDSTMTAIGRWEGATGSDPAALVDRRRLLHVVWIDEGSGNREVLHTTFNLVTGVLSGEETLSQTSGIPADPALAADRQGRVHIVWSEADEGTAFLRHRQWAGSGWDSVTTVPVASELGVASPDIACDPDGNLHLVWQHSGLASSTVMYAYRSPGGEWSEPEKVSVEEPKWFVGSPVVAASEAAVWVAWSETNARSARLHVRAQSGDGWSPIRSPSAATTAGQPSAVVDAWGTLHLVWIEGRSPSLGSTVFYSSMAAGDTVFAPPRPLSPAGGGPFSAPLVTADRSGRLVVAWMDTGAGRGDIICRTGMARFAVLPADKHTVQ